jgi:hypothetical protein
MCRGVENATGEEGDAAVTDPKSILKQGSDSLLRRSLALKKEVY